MLQVNFIREQKERVVRALEKRNYKNIAILEEVIALDDLRKANQFKLDEALSEANKIASEVPKAFKEGRSADADKLKARASELKEINAQTKSELEAAKEQLNALLLQIPNCLSEMVPAGVSADDNEVYKEMTGPKAELPTGAQPHWELAKKYDIIDLELGVKITGAGFPVYKGKGARLQRALINFFLDEATAAGFTEMQVPLLVNEDSARGTGQLPDKDGQMYYCPVDDLYLIPTAEVPVTNLYRDVTVKEEELPIKMCGYTPCFRREAGSYGAHVRGLNRLHQFDKIEIVCLEHPERSYDTLMTMLAHVESLLVKLELPYRILRLCGGDTGFASAMTFDFETWSAAQERWLEVSSVSNFETYQSNRMNFKFKNKQGKNELGHTLNGSALALPRIVATLLENHQTAEGIRIPKALIPYTGFEFIN